MTNDNCSVAMSTEEDGEILSHVMTFIPEGRIDEKSEFEKFDYRAAIAAGICIAGNTHPCCRGPHNKPGRIY